MRKEIILTLVISLFTLTASAQTLQEFDYNPDESEYPVSITGGESFTQTINFTNDLGDSVPLGILVKVDAEDTKFAGGEDVGNEFSLTGDLSNSFGEEELVFDSKISNGNLVYTGSLNNSEELEPGSENSLELNVNAYYGLKPDSFDFEFIVKSVLAFSDESQTVNITEGEANLNAGAASAEIQTENGTNATLEHYSEIQVPAPKEESKFVNGLGVEVKDKNGSKTDAEGKITLEYSAEKLEDDGLNESTLRIYYYDEEDKEWTEDGVDNVEVNSLEQEVSANVEHFSTYALYADEDDESQTTQTSQSGGGSSSSNSETGEDNQSQESPQTNQSDNETQDGDQNNQGNVGDGTQPDETQNNESEEPGQQNQNSQSPTGRFIGNPTNVTWILVLLLAVVVAVVELSRRGKFDQTIDQIINKLEEM